MRDQVGFRELQLMGKDRNVSILRAVFPIVVGAGIALLPAPAGLTHNAWYFFALFAAVITGAVTEPLPVAAVVFAGIAVAAVTGLVFSAPSSEDDFLGTC